MAKDRSITVRLRAEVSDFQRQIGNAGRSLSDFERAQQQMGGAATTTMGRFVQSAKINQREWQTVGRTLTIAGAAVGTFGTALLTTGIQYNSLRQTATAALTSVTDSTEEAAAQMKRLDDYGQNSWLMRDTLIRAQQQMTGFGIETEKVIPYMDALAEATAATGGNNQTFEELAGIMAKIEGQSKITAEELNQFGIRGIDAATLIGDAMGKTGGEIREEITAGTLDATTALDALAEGMKSKYAGASDLVRNTFQGAMDDVKAAWRDAGAALATPLVDPEGGGLAVDFLNKLADAMRQFSDAPSWVQYAVGGVGALTTAVLLGSGAFMLALPKFIEFRTAIKTLSAVHPALGRFTTGLGKLGVAAGIAGVALGALLIGGQVAQSIRESKRSVDDIELSLRNLDTTADFTAQQMDNVAVAIDRIQNPTLGDWIYDTAVGWTGLSSVSDVLAGDLEAMGDALANMYASNPEQAAEAFDAILARTNLTTEEALELMPGYALALKRAADGSEDAAGATDSLTGSTEEATGAIQAHIDALEEQYQKQQDAARGALDAATAEIRYKDTVQTSTDAIKENGKGFDINTEKGRANRSALIDVASAGLDHVDAMRKQDATTRELQGEMKNIRTDFLKAASAAGIGATEANRMADKLGLIPGNYHASVSVDTAVARGRVATLQSAINAIRSKSVRITATVGTIGNIPGMGLVNRGMLYDGGWVGKGLADGGWVPGQRAGYDNVAWPLRAGGSVMTQPLEGKEFVVRSSMAAKYGGLLEDINEGRLNGGTPTTGGTGGGDGPTLYITNYYPQAEPTSVTTNRAQQYAAAIGEM